jgi:hypothetical protein
MVKMFLVKVECKNVTVEKIAENLAEITEPGFRVWLYKKKVYSIFKVGSISTLRALILNFKANNVKFRFYRIERVKE